MKSKYNIKWIFSYVKGARLKLGFLGLISVIMSVCHVLISLIIKFFIEIASAETDRSLGFVAVFAASVIVIYAVSHIFSSLLRGGIYNVTEKKYRLTLIKSILTKKFIKLQDIHSGEMLTRLTLDTGSLSNFFPNIIGQITAEILTSLLAITLLFILSWKMAIILVSLVIVLLLLMRIFPPILQKRSENDLKNEDANRKYMQDSLGQLLLFKVYKMEEKIENRVDALYQKKAISKIRLAMIEGLMGFLNNFFGFSLMIITMGVGSYFVVRGETTVSSLIAMIQLSNYIVMPLNNVSRWVAEYNKAIVSAKRVGEILDLPVSDKPEGNKNQKKADKIIVENLCFGYENGNKTVLQEANAVFLKNEITSIIGESGSGKSTLLKLVMGLYEPDVGHIKLVSEINGITEELIHNDIAYVPSNKFLFNSTIKENIIMADEEDQKLLEKVSADANILNFVKEFDEEFDFLVTEAGQNLSMGQQQRVAVARALYKNVSCIIFDEPTANLDPESVKIFHNMLRDIAKDRICIIVTHDVSTMQFSNKVYILKDNTLVLDSKGAENEQNNLGFSQQNRLIEQEI